MTSQHELAASEYLEIGEFCWCGSFVVLVVGGICGWRWQGKLDVVWTDVPTVVASRLSFLATTTTNTTTASA